MLQRLPRRWRLDARIPHDYRQSRSRRDNGPYRRW